MICVGKFDKIKGNRSEVARVQQPARQIELRYLTDNSDCATQK